MINKALALAKKGFYVFPLRIGGSRRPAIKGWQDKASIDPEKIRVMWSGRFEKCGVGISTGKSGLAVIDVDNKHGKNGSKTLDLLELEFGDLPATVTALTQSGGKHYYFKGRCQSKVEILGEGLDTRGEGGLVVAYDLEGWDSGIADLPEWVSKMVGVKSWKAADMTPKIPESKLDSTNIIARAIQHLKYELPPAVEGKSGDFMTYKVAAHCKGIGLTMDKALELMEEHYNPRCEPPWSFEDLEVKVHSGYTSLHEDGLGGATPYAEFEGVHTDDKWTAEKKKIDRAVAEGKHPYEAKDYGMFDDWIWVAKQEGFLLRRSGETVKKEAFNVEFGYMFSEVVKTPFKLVVEEKQDAIRKVHNYIYEPLTGPYIKHEGLLYYNIWRDTGIKPMVGDPTPFLDHVNYLTNGRRREASLVLDYLAWMVQKPREKLGHALLVQGQPGTGKSKLGEVMRLILGATNTSVPRNKELAENYNGWFGSKQLVIINELMATGRYEVANELKPLITEPHVRVREMWQKPYEQDTYANFIMFTNYEDAIPIEKNDRRYLVIMSETPAKAATYYDHFVPWLEGEGASIIAGYLMQRDISHYNGKGHAPMTEDKRQMKIKSRGPIMEWLHEEMVECKNPPFNRRLICVKDVFEAAPDLIRRVKGYQRQAMQIVEEFGAVRILGENGQIARCRIEGSAGPKMRLWSLKSHKLFDGLPPAEVGRLYMAETEKLAIAEFGDSDEAMGTVIDF